MPHLYYKYFMDSLLDTVRDGIAECSEVRVGSAYTDHNQPCCRYQYLRIVIFVNLLASVLCVFLYLFIPSFLFGSVLKEKAHIMRPKFLSVLSRTQGFANPPFDPVMYVCVFQCLLFFFKAPCLLFFKGFFFQINVSVLLIPLFFFSFNALCSFVYLSLFFSSSFKCPSFKKKMHFFPLFF